MTDNKAALNLLTAWPQGQISGDCFAVVSLDLTAPFVRDMGLFTDSNAILRDAIRSSIRRDPGILQGATESHKKEWINAFMKFVGAGDALEDFSKWVLQTFTHVPADRPNWEAYQTFFFEWAVHMRDGSDIAGCFEKGDCVFRTYKSFVASRGLSQRIQDHHMGDLSSWDQQVFTWCGYSLNEGELEDFERFADPFALVRATAERSYFQEFWDYIHVRLTDREKESLYAVLRNYHRDRPWQDGVVSPDALKRGLEISSAWWRKDG